MSLPPPLLSCLRMGKGKRKGRVLMQLPSKTFAMSKYPGEVGVQLLLLMEALQGM